MPNEIEVKMRVLDKRAVEEALSSQTGYVDTHATKIVDEYYDSPDGELMGKGVFLRIRKTKRVDVVQNGWDMVITAKGPVSAMTEAGTKTREEIELQVDESDDFAYDEFDDTEMTDEEYEQASNDSEFSKVDVLFKLIGLAPTVTVTKVRETIRNVNGCEVCVDTVENLGDFVEIEGRSQESVDETISILGLDDPSIAVMEPSGYAEMMFALEAD